MTRILVEARKAVVAACGLLSQAVALGLLHGTVLHVAQAVLAAATTYGVWRVPNGSKG